MKLQHSITVDSTPRRNSKLWEFPINVSLPRELLVDILLRLPVKVISLCKCVCKKWCFLIESPSFVKQHFDQESNRGRLLVRLWEQNHAGHNVDEEPDQNDEEVDVLWEQNQAGHNVNEEPDQNDEVIHMDPDYIAFMQEMIYFRQQALEDEGHYKCALYVDETFSEFEVPYHHQMPEEVSYLIGPLNGVFCVVTQYPWGPMALLNPALRQFKPLPLVERFYPQNLGFFFNELGFGFDALTGDYRLVMLLYFLDFRTEEQHFVAYVCTSDSDSWRLLEGVVPIISSRRVCRSLGVTYLNGVYYWLLESNGTTNVAILAFDMVAEEFREIPVVGPVAQSETGYLALCGDSLTLLVYDQTERCIDVWMMVNEGCWIRSSRVGPLDDFRQPLCFWTNDELLLETMTGSLTRCNISTQESKIIVAQDDEKCAFLHWVFVYKESLVSIKGEVGKCRLWDPSSDFIKNFFQESSSERYS